MSEEASPFASHSPPPPRPSYEQTVYGSFDPPSSSHDSGVEVSPTDPPQRGFPPRQRYYITPPNINGHGRRVLAHRTVPHLIGAVLVIAVFAWGVCAAIFAFPLLGGRPHSKSGHKG